jgi:hypothetical protein
MSSLYEEYGVYLTSDGIHPREVKGLTQLDASAEWTFYAGLQYFPGHDTPIEMDLIILMDDRVLPFPAARTIIRTPRPLGHGQISS